MQSRIYLIWCSCVLFCRLSAKPWLLRKIIGLKLDPFVVTAGLLLIEITIIWVPTWHLLLTTATMSLATLYSTMIILMITQEISGSIAITVNMPRLMHLLWKGEKLPLLAGKVIWDRISNLIFMKMVLQQTGTVLLVWEVQDLMQINLLAVNVTVQVLKMRIWCLCRGMKLRDAPLQGKMESMHFKRPACDIHIAISFRILEFS